MTTISEFLLQAGTQFWAFDLSRGIQLLPSQQFLEIESGIIAHPSPRQQHAWFAIVFNNKMLTAQHYIWFVKLPLDEIGKVQDAARSQFLQIIVEALGRDMQQGENGSADLPENPFSFVPNQQQMADFNSLCRKTLIQPPSEHFKPTQGYFANPSPDSWQTLAMQGISDFVVFSSDTELTAVLQHQLPTLPEPVISSLFSSLENRQINKAATQAVLDFAENNAGNHRLQGLAQRAISQSTANALVSNYLMQLLTASNNELSLDSLVVIAGRHWQRLHNNPALLTAFFEKLASQPQTAESFSALFADLVQIPLLRTEILGLIRQADRSEALSRAIGKLFTHEVR
ncbi:DUF3549 family protein [Neptunicella marina]|uniref:DUF3549 family protein n=1 Tax=Neptunicella marina TaxID=2125989 RepID=A0A8J6LXL9_9ALTE|nr:DUF3549 family protein [Neptunicella marina]MBC3764900.1 DUF3549 family protein [Neptunicella marina]